MMCLRRSQVKQEKYFVSIVFVIPAASRLTAGKEIPNK